MTKTISKKELQSIDRYVVLNDKTALFTSFDPDLIKAKIEELQMENTPLILVNDEQEKTTIAYKKGRYEKNYRVEAYAYQECATATTETVTVPVRTDMQADN
jgi:predicted Ser/Thr protein kinase